MRAREQQVGYQGTAVLIFPPLQHTSPVQYNHTAPQSTLDFVVFNFHLLNSDRQKNTHVWQCSSEGRAFVPGSQFVLVLLCFTVQAYKQTAREQLLSKWTPGWILLHIQSHTNTHMCWHTDTMSVSRCSCTQNQMPLSFDIFSLYCCHIGATVRHHRRIFPCPWWLSALDGSDEGRRWELKGRWGGKKMEQGVGKDWGRKGIGNVGDKRNESGKSKR